MFQEDGGFHVTIVRRILEFLHFYIITQFYSANVLTLKAPITTTADGIHYFFSLFFRENKT